MSTTIAGIGVEAVEHNQEPGTLHTRFDQERTAPSMAVLASLAELLETDPVELDPLHSSVDLEALDALVSTRQATIGDIQITFSHDEYTITVNSGGEVTVSPAVVSDGQVDLTVGSEPRTDEQK